MLELLFVSMVFSSIMLVEGQIEEHDLLVSWEAPIIDERNHLINGTSVILNATIRNDGSHAEDVTLQLLINGTGVLNSSTHNLAPGHVFWSAYFWTPEVGDYYLTAYAPPVMNETHTDNNNDTKRVRVCPYQRPIANFTFEPEIEPNIIFVDENVIFDASDSHDDLDWGAIVRYEWNWNGTTTDTTTEPIINHTFHEHGTYNVSLVVVDNEGLSSLPTWQLVTAEKKPHAFFTIKEGHVYGEGPPPYYVHDNLTFDASGSRPDGGHIVWYYWDFNDTTVENKTWRFTQHSYSYQGIYNVTLTICDNNTLTDSFNRMVIVVVGIPIAHFTVSSPEPPYHVNDTLEFDASVSHDSDWGNIDLYHWDFADSTPVVNETDPIASHKYMAEGHFTVTLTVTDNDSLTGEPFNMTVPVTFRVYLRVEPRTVIAKPGDRLDINVTIENVKDIKSFMFRLGWPPDWLPHSTWPILLGEDMEVKAGSFLGPSHGPEGQRYNFKKTEDEGEGFIFVNCSFFTDIVPIDERTGNGTLAEIQLTVKTSGNSTLSLTEIVLLNSTDGPISCEVEHGYFYTTRPVADFSYSRPAVPNETVTFNASFSFDPDNPYDLTPGPIANYAWDFGDGTNDTGKIVTNVFISGVFYVNLTITDDDGEKWWNIYRVSTSNMTLRVEPCRRALNETAGFYETAGKLPIAVIVTNDGTTTETFTVRVYANDTIVGTQDVPVPSGQSRNLTFYLYAFHWNTSCGLPKGTYNVSACALGFPGKEYASHLVRVYLTGDVIRDGNVNVYDAVKLLKCYGAKEGSPNYDPSCDLDCDGDIDVYDAVALLVHYGEKDP